MRAGIGYDIHAFEKGRKLVLGGVEIENELGLGGHSDADVLVHSIMDALLGAAGLDDIGIHFPNDDKKYRNISSLILLNEVRKNIESAGFEIINIDSVVILEAPRIAPYVTIMKKKIAEALMIEESRINIKATTSEGMGFCGRNEGAAAQSIALLQ
jgi:2-C-methyl-D-erythritol 2,4-cyclodiphosphate synthase